MIRFGKGYGWTGHTDVHAQRAFLPGNLLKNGGRLLNSKYETFSDH
jgi:hypothetical protein